VGRIPEDTIQVIRDRVDIVDLVGRHVSLKKAGRSFKGLCPFHQEKTPSFIVSPDRGTYHCFGCGEGGNAFAFLMRHENLTFPEAARSLAAELGIEIPESGGGDRGLSEQIFRANAVAQEFYRASLSSSLGKGAVAYLERRGLDPETVEHFEIGFAPDRWDGAVGALAKERIAASVGQQAGLLKERERGGHYDLLRGRITFPIRDVRGRVVGFGGRALGEGQEPKYLNTPESPVFRKREAFYGFPKSLEPIRQRERAVVVEGYFDLIALQRAGVAEVLATCGTALTEEHARNLRRRTRNVVLLFDGDEAGQRAILRALEVLLPQGLRVSAVALPAGEDPDDFLARQGAEALAGLIEAAGPALDLAIGRAVSAGCTTPWERADAVAAVVPLLAAIPEPVERGEFARRLAMAAGTEAADVEAALRRAVRRESPEEPEVVAPRRQTLEERRFADVLRILLDHPHHGAAEGEAILEHAPDRAWSDLAERLLRECQAAPASSPATSSVRSTARPPGLDVAALVDQVEGEPRQRLVALAADPLDGLDDAERALQALRDTLAWLRSRQDRREARELNARLTESRAEAPALLEKKQQQLERRRLAQGIVSS